MFFVPLFYALPGIDNAHFEDSWESLVMLTNNHALLGRGGDDSGGVCEVE